MEQAYRRLRMDRPDPATFSLRLATAEFGPLAAQRVRLSGSSGAATNDGTGLIRVGHLTHGSFATACGPDEVAGAAAFLFPSACYAGQWEDLGLTTLTLEYAVVVQQARALLDREDFRLVFTGPYPVDAAKGVYWRATVRHFLEDVLPNDQALTSPLVAGETVRSVVTALLHTFPSTFLGPHVPPGDVAPAALRRAKEFIDAHLAEPIGIADIAAAARMSPRGTQSLFQRHLGTTPTVYLRTVRLDAAHTDLTVADPTGTTVAAIAARWGFTHASRFAAAYRHAFGESPAATLHR